MKTRCNITSVTVEVQEIKGHDYTGEFRCPTKGEPWTDGYGVLSCFYIGRPAFILKRHWVWPTWLKADYIQLGYNNVLLACSRDPNVVALVLNEAMLDLDVPDIPQGARIYNPNKPKKNDA